MDREGRSIHSQGHGLQGSAATSLAGPVFHHFMQAQHRRQASRTQKAGAVSHVWYSDKNPARVSLERSIKYHVPKSAPRAANATDLALCPNALSIAFKIQMIEKKSAMTVARAWS